MKEHVLKAFWHRSRKAFLPWTVEEIARRTKTSTDHASSALRELCKNGLASYTATHVAGINAWKLTTEGMVQARAILAAEEFARGQNA